MGNVVVIVAMWTGISVVRGGVFLGNCGTLQAVLTPNLHLVFPRFAFISFFTSHSGIIIGVVS